MIAAIGKSQVAVFIRDLLPINVKVVLAHLSCFGKFILKQKVTQL